MTVERLRALADNWRDNEASAANDGEYEVADAYRLCAGMTEALADAIEEESRVGQVPDGPGLWFHWGPRRKAWAVLRITLAHEHVTRLRVENGVCIAEWNGARMVPTSWALAQTWGSRVAEPPKPEGA